MPLPPPKPMRVALPIADWGRGLVGKACAWAYSIQAVSRMPAQTCKLILMLTPCGDATPAIGQLALESK